MKNSHKKKKILLITSLIAILFFIIYIIRILSYTYIKIEFDDLRPFHTHAPVYFKGFKIGHVVNIKPADDYQKTIITIAIHPINTKFPINTKAKIKIHKTRWLYKDYIDLIYPDAPELKYLKTGSTIKGQNSIDIHSYLANLSPETYLQIEENAANIMQNLDDTTGLLLSIFSIAQNILQDSQSDIRNSISNLEETTANTKDLTKKINETVTKKQIQTTLTNLTDSSDNLKTFTDDLNKTTSNVKQSIPNLHATILDINSIIKNIYEITCGIKCTMRKHFGGLRLLFGQPTNKNCIRN